MKTALQSLLIITILIILLIPLPLNARPLCTESHLKAFTYPPPISLMPQTITLYPHENRTLTFSPTIQLQNNTFLTGIITISTTNTTISPLLQIHVNLNQQSMEQQTQYTINQNTTTVVFATYNAIITQNPNFIHLSMYNLKQSHALSITIQGSVTVLPTQQPTSFETPLSIPIYPYVFTLNETNIQPLYVFMPNQSYSVLNLTIISTDQNYQILTETNVRYSTTTHVLTNISLANTGINEIVPLTYKKTNQTIFPIPIILQALITPINSSHETNPIDTKFITILFASLFYIIPLILRHYSYLQEQKKVNT